MVDLIKSGHEMEFIEHINLINNVMLIPTFNIKNENLTKTLREYKPSFFVYCYSGQNNPNFVLPKNLESIKVMLPSQITDLDEMKIKKNIQMILGLITKNYLTNKKTIILSDKISTGMIILLSFLVANSEMKLEEIVKYANTKLKNPIDLNFDLNQNYLRIINYINS